MPALASSESLTPFGSAEPVIANNVKQSQAMPADYPFLLAYARSFPLKGAGPEACPASGGESVGRLRLLAGQPLAGRSPERKIEKGDKE